MSRPVLLAAMLALLPGGCAALTNPVADGIPVRRLPAEVLGRPKADLRPVPLTALQQREASPYRVDKGDVLAVDAPGIVAPEAQVAPVQLPGQQAPTAAVGFPVPVREDGTISFPELPPILVRGLSLIEIENLVREYATGQRPGGKALIQPNQRISVQILQKREYLVTVVREDTQPIPVLTGTTVFGGNRRGNGYTLRMRAGENDVLRALNQTGGPPGLDARDEVTVLRNLKPGRPLDPNRLIDAAARSQLVQSGEVLAVRIPLRIYPEQPLSIREEDIILKDGDIVLIQARDTEVYYTAGIIGAAQYALPRDYDLNVLQAIAAVRAPLINGAFNQNQFTASSVNGGIGQPSPSLCTVLRQLPDKRQIPIRVDINRAFKDPRERILILPGDVIVLQERPGEAIGRYLTQVFRFSTALPFFGGGATTGLLNGNF